MGGSSRRADNLNELFRGLTFPILSEKGKAPFSFRFCEPNDREFWDYRKGREDNYMGAKLADLVYGVTDLPTTFIVDKNQRIREVVVGQIDFEKLQEKIRRYQ